MEGYFKKQNPSEFVDNYIENRKKRATTTEELKTFLAKCAVSSVDTDIYGAILILAELKLKRVYSSTFVDKLTKNFIKIVHDKAIKSTKNYNRYYNFFAKYENRLYDELDKFRASGKSEPELMQDDFYFRLIESIGIMNVLKEDLREVAYTLCPSKRPKKDDRVE